MILQKRHFLAKIAISVKQFWICSALLKRLGWGNLFCCLWCGQCIDHNNQNWFMSNKSAWDRISYQNINWLLVRYSIVIPRSSVAYAVQLILWSMDPLICAPIHRIGGLWLDAVRDRNVTLRSLLLKLLTTANPKCRPF